MLNTSLRTEVLSHYMCSLFDAKEQVKWPDLGILCQKKGRFAEGLKPL